MTTQEDFTVEATEVEAVTTQPEIEDSVATNTQEDYDNLVLKLAKVEEDKENYRKATLKYKKGESLDNDNDEKVEVKDTTSKTFTAEEVQEIATKAAEAALNIERAKTEEVIKTNAELKRSLAGKAATGGFSEGSVDTSKTDTPYFSDNQKAFLAKLGLTEEEVLKTKERNKNFLS